MPDFGYGKPMTQEQLSHYYKVKRARKEQGLPVYTDQVKWDHRADENNEIGTTNRFGREKIEGSEHPLLGMRLYDIVECQVMIVDSVSNLWLDGYYIQMAIREKGTNDHALIFWENINSENESIIEGVKKAQNRYKVIEKNV